MMAFGDKISNKDAGISVQQKIATQIAELAPSVEEAVVNTLVERELTKRSEAVVQCMDTLGKLEGDIRKIKPDQVSYDSDGKIISESFSRNKFEEKKKLIERIGKYTSAITKAIEKADFSDVYNLKNQGAGGSSSNKETDTETDQ